MLDPLVFERVATEWTVLYKGSQLMVLAPYALGGWRIMNPKTRLYTYRLDRQGD